jgi:hypothetical protein
MNVGTVDNLVNVVVTEFQPVRSRGPPVDNSVVNGVVRANMSTFPSDAAYMIRLRNQEKVTPATLERPGAWPKEIVAPWTVPRYHRVRRLPSLQHC